MIWSSYLDKVRFLEGFWETGKKTKWIWIDDKNKIDARNRCVKDNVNGLRNTTISKDSIPFSKPPALLQED